MTGITASPTELTVEVGKKVSFSYAVKPANATNAMVNVTIKDKAIATLSVDDTTQKATVTGVAAGATQATARSLDGNFEATVAITVTEPGA